MAEIVLALGLLAGIYMAWNIGANDIANGMASPVAAKAITLRQAVFIGGFLDFVGAAFIGSHVTSTISSGILKAELVTDPQVMSVGLLSALLASAFWVFVATWKQLPVSTTHSIVGAVVGFGIVVGGVSAVKWGKIIPIILSWLISPVFAGFLAYMIFVFIRRRILRKPKLFLEALRWTPFFSGATILIVMLSLLTKTPLGERLGLNPGASAAVSILFTVVLGFAAKKWMAKTIRKVEEEGVEEIFRRLQVFTACYVSLAHGANDVANAIGPVAGIFAIYKMGHIPQSAEVPFFLLAGGGIFIAIGVFTWGYRVIETIGHKITILNNTRGFSVDFGTATSVLIASKMGLPVSTTHAAVGAVIGVGLAGGLAAVDFKMVWKITLYWLITLPLAALPTIVIFKILEAIFL
ncbi:inorganic phosphate transporter [Desulforhabdus amnigena]|jgi:PiT family inorganic phosphate transporter|uniref:Phosphate transporter n=1 Tax=Desulforhabdus amnigena TaxID=40218 RepID=A0A9W6LAS2_9BACT|nr:inorganic phosphate transporter [Desulforhabdus amnigena]NLJ28549.1 inorganic phosphate transporter [Deltaproteobacteria bacterium]GLI36300.1 phosphate permease [Desulforhabdus amnigena]